MSSLYIYELLENRSRIISTSISGSKESWGGRPVLFLRATMWHLLQHAESLYYKARRTCTRTEVLIYFLQCKRLEICAVYTVLQKQPPSLIAITLSNREGWNPRTSLPQVFICFCSCGILWASENVYFMALFPRLWTKIHQIRGTCIHTGVINVCKAVLQLTISCTIPEIFAIKSRSCPKSGQNSYVFGQPHFWAISDDLQSLIFRVHCPHGVEEGKRYELSRHYGKGPLRSSPIKKERAVAVMYTADHKLRWSIQISNEFHQHQYMSSYETQYSWLHGSVPTPYVKQRNPNTCINFHTKWHQHQVREPD